MISHKDKVIYQEKSRKKKMAELADLEKYPSPMSESFRRPAYDGTALCPDSNRRTHKAIKKVSTPIPNGDDT